MFELGEARVPCAVELEGANLVLRSCCYVATRGGSKHAGRILSTRNAKVGGSDYYLCMVRVGEVMQCVRLSCARIVFLPFASHV